VCSGGVPSGGGGAPRSCGVRSSTAAAIVSQRTSVSASLPRSTGVAAVSARKIGESTARWSYRWRLSSTSRAWKVTCKQQQPMP